MENIKAIEEELYDAMYVKFGTLGTNLNLTVSGSWHHWVFESSMATVPENSPPKVIEKAKLDRDYHLELLDYFEKITVEYNKALFIPTMTWSHDGGLILLKVDIACFDYKYFRDVKTQVRRDVAKIYSRYYE